MSDDLSVDLGINTRTGNPLQHKLFANAKHNPVSFLKRNYKTFRKEHQALWLFANIS